MNANEIFDIANSLNKSAQEFYQLKDERKLLIETLEKVVSADAASMPKLREDIEELLRTIKK